MTSAGSTVPIPGTKRVRYLEENVAAASIELSDADLAALTDAVPVDAVQGERYPDMSSIDHRLLTTSPPARQISRSTRSLGNLARVRSERAAALATPARATHVG